MDISKDIINELAKYLNVILGNLGIRNVGSGCIIDITPFAWIIIRYNLPIITILDHFKVKQYNYNIHNPDCIDDIAYKAIDIQYRYQHHLKQKARHKHGH